jgi:DNA-binding response OmpR family regulator/DNA-binding CsgD family transcriptional regulator
MALKNFVELYAKSFHLTERETEVFYNLVNRVVSPVELLKKLENSLNTLNPHLKKIHQKTQSDSKTELLADFLLFLEKQKSSEPPAIRPRVLILDDETELTKMLQQFFHMRGIDSHVYDDAVKALDAIRKLKIDVVVSDIRMPNMNGLSFLSEIRKFHYYEPGLIFISGFPEEYGIETLLDLGAFAFLEKPVDLERLHRLVWEYIFGVQPKAELPAPDLTLRLGDQNLRPRQLGFGGFFLDQKQIDGSTRLEPGGKVELEFRLPESPELHRAICEVVWKRLEGEATPGYGLKFLELNPQSKRKVLDLVRMNNILSFIPRSGA